MVRTFFFGGICFEGSLVNWWNHLNEVLVLPAASKARHVKQAFSKAWVLEVTPWTRRCVRYTRSLTEAMGIAVRESGSRGSVENPKFWKAEKEIKRGVNVGVNKDTVCCLRVYNFSLCPGFILNFKTARHLSSRGLNWCSMSFNFRIPKCYLFEMRRALARQQPVKNHSLHTPKVECETQKKGGKLEVESW